LSKKEDKIESYKKSKSKKKMLSVMIETDTKKAMQELADSHNLKLSDIGRIAIDDFIKKDNDEDNNE